MMLIGMALMKMGVFSAAKSYRFYLVMVGRRLRVRADGGNFVVWNCDANTVSRARHALADAVQRRRTIGGRRWATSAVVMMICKAVH